MPITTGFCVERGHVAICSGDKTVRDALREAALEMGFGVRLADGCGDLPDLLAATGDGLPYAAALIDIDEGSFDMDFFARLGRTAPKTRLIALSRTRHHPELRQALETHIFASLSLPVAKDELAICLKDLTTPGAQAAGHGPYKRQAEVLE